ncbi:glycosyltransferase family A protein [Nocardioides astragali]|uniref:Glycosyltransferase family A protein n=1 Tax=Nocardioides astragali TaxID=1776736 RepID=A0ABW2N540_9ACTN|nr:glycosyltransferase family A protein [Nocardioides astragali]
MSIVIPCFNDGAHLGEAVASAFAQDHDDYEVIVADDGSVDTVTLEALDEAKQHGARVLRCQHAGVSSARNAAIGAATGEYILPLDADDRLATTYVRQASSVLDTDPDVGIVGAGTEFFGSGTGEMHPAPPAPAAWLVANQLPVSAMFRRDDWVRCGGYDEDLRWGEDWHLWVKIVALGRTVRLLSTVGLYYRRRPGQVTENVPWDVQESTRARILQAGLPIINRFPNDASRILAAQLNQLQAVRQRPSERLRTAALRVLGR